MSEQSDIIDAILKAREILERADVPTDNRSCWVVGSGGNLKRILWNTPLVPWRWPSPSTKGNRIAREKCRRRNDKHIR